MSVVPDPQHYNFTDPLGLSNCFISPRLEPIPFPVVQNFLFWLYICTSAFSLLGNSLVIIVQLFGSKTSPNMRKYLSNLAIADVITGVFSVPFTYAGLVYGHWPYPAWLCPTAQFVQLLSSFLISTTLSIIGIERYIITVYPLSRASHFLKCHSTGLLGLFWLLGAVYAFIPTHGTAVSEFQIITSNSTFLQCHFHQNTSNELLNLKLLMVLNFSLTFLLPLALISGSYVAIRRRLQQCTERFNVHYQSRANQASLGRQYQQPSKASVTDDAFRCSHSLEQRSKIITLMFIVILLYCICWFPVKLFQLGTAYRIISYCSEAEFYLVIGAYIFCHWLAMANAFVNPILYGFLSRSFRIDLRKITASVVAVCR